MATPQYEIGKPYTVIAHNAHHHTNSTTNFCTFIEYKTNYFSSADFTHSNLLSNHFYQTKHTVSVIRTINKCSSNAKFTTNRYSRSNHMVSIKLHRNYSSVFLHE